MIDKRLAEITDCLYRVAVKALIVREGKLLISKEEERQFGDLNLRGIPGGGVDYGENFQQSLIRELREELKLEVLPEQIAEQPVRTSFGELADGKFAADRNVPTVLFYFPVRLLDNQEPVAGENGFEWVNAAEMQTVNFVSQTAADREFLIEFLNNY